MDVGEAASGGATERRLGGATARRVSAAVLLPGKGGERRPESTVRREH